MAENREGQRQVQEINQELEDLQAPRRRGVKVGLGTLHDDLRRIDERLTRNARGDAPRDGRPGLASVIPFPGNTAAAAGSTMGNNDAERTERLRRIGAAMEARTSLERGGARNETLNSINARTFEKFVEQTQNREKILADATEEQRRIFEELEKTLTELREAGSEDSEKLRDRLAELGGQLGETEDTKAKGSIGYQIATARGNAQPSNLGTVFAAMKGDRGAQLLKEGYVREGENIRNTETGRFAGIKEAGQGRLRSAMGNLGSFIGRKTEEYVEGGRSEAFQGFLDRNVRANPRGQQAAELGGAIEQLRSQTGAGVAPSANKAEVIPLPTAKSMSPAAGAINITAKTVTVTGNIKMPKTAAAGAAPATPATTMTSSAGTSRPAAAAAAAGAAPAAAAQEGGGILEGAGDLISGAGGLGGGGGMLATAGTALGLGALGYAAGAAGDWASGALKESGHEEAGKAVGTLGRAGEYAGYGAAIGSIVPGVGTAVGAGVGAAVGGIKGAYEQYADPNKGVLENVGDFAKWSGKKVGNTLLQGASMGMLGVDDQGNISREAGITNKALAGAKEFLGLGEKLPNFSSKGTGEASVRGEVKDGKYYLNSKEVSREDYKKAYDASQASMNTAMGSEGAQLKQTLRGGEIGRNSSVNQQLQSQPARAATMVPATAGAAPSGGSNMMLPRASVRPTESALERYTARGSSFY